MGFGQNLAAHEQHNGGRVMQPSRSEMDSRTLIGRSAAFRGVLEIVRRAAIHPAANVLLVGETGTGKELFARAIHCASERAGEPFVAINCSAIPEALLESELFGHEKGAFTDARSPKRGLLEVAGRGTVMLDEVSELPLGLQPKLLRVLEERKVRRLGAVHEYDVGCRVIAAANKDIARCAEDGSFRSDLYYRLNVLRIDIPPLRERHGDLELLAEHFIRVICQDHGLGIRQLSPEALALLRSHEWVGNVRELKNTLESAIMLSDAEVVRPEHIPLRPRAALVRWRDHASGAAAEPTGSGARTIPHAAAQQGPSNAFPGAWHRTGTAQMAAGASVASPLQLPPGGITLETMERLLIGETLRNARGNRSLAARMLGISRPTVIRKIERYGLA